MSVRVPEPQATGVVTLERVLAFAHVSGDDNPIHISPESAREAGLDGPIVHGMFIAGRFEAFLEQLTDHRTVALQVRFVRPAPVGCDLTIKARLIEETGPLLHLRLLATLADGPLVAIGEARLEFTGSL